MKFTAFVELLILSILIEKILKSFCFHGVKPNILSPVKCQKRFFFLNFDQWFLIVFFIKTMSKIKSEAIFGILMKRLIEPYET
jgi:hypothetical protein